MSDDPELEPELYYGNPDNDNYCSFRYTIRKFAPDNLRCPDFISFYVKIPDGRGSDWRKARASCRDHLADVIWRMQEDHGRDGGFYGGEYLLRAAEL